jgi:virulence plasmid B protein
MQNTPLGVKNSLLRRGYSMSRQVTAILLAVSFILTPMQIAFAKEAAPPIKSTPKESLASPPGDTAVKDKTDPGKRPAITLPLPAQSHANPPGLNKGKDAPPPVNDGGFSILSADDDFPFTYERLNHANAPKLTPNENVGSFQYAIPIITPPGRNGLGPDLALTYDSSDSKNEYFGLGWSLNIPYIERINRTGAENLYSDNYFSSSLDGELKAEASSSMEMMSSEGGGFLLNEQKMTTEGQTSLASAISDPAQVSISQMLEGKTPAERANIKSSEIVKVVSPGEYQDGVSGALINIQSIETIDGRVQIFARASKNGGQLGFGSDGSVDIERFRIFDPRILVDDPNGTITRVATRADGTTYERHLREDWSRRRDKHWRRSSRLSARRREPSSRARWAKPLTRTTRNRVKEEEIRRPMAYKIPTPHRYHGPQRLPLAAAGHSTRW